jgi:hypothetical protein
MLGGSEIGREVGGDSEPGREGIVGYGVGGISG